MSLDWRDNVAFALLEAASTLLQAEIDVPHDKWLKVTIDDLKSDPKLVDRLYDLIQTAYKPIGGHLKIKNPQDLVNGDITLFHLKDLDGDKQPDEVVFSKEEKDGEKMGGMGHDGSKKAKQDSIDFMAKKLQEPGHYAEVSEALAHIILTRYPDVPLVENQEHVEKALQKLNPDEYREKHGKCPHGYNFDDGKHKCLPSDGSEPKAEKRKSIKWMGQHPEGKYPGKNGWYERTIGGKNVHKIMVGLPESTKK
jgi:hypothetical protein